MRNVRAILFDVYGTLATWYPDRYVLHSRAASKFDIEVTKEGIDAGYAVAEAYMTRQNSESPIRLMTHEERDQFFARFEQMILRACGTEVDLDLADRIWREVAKQEYELALYDDVLSNLNALRAEDYIVGIVSNVPSTGTEVADQLGLSDSIDFAVTSSEVGAEKPDRRIFDEALRRADDTPPSAAMMVGDQISSDVEGAVEAGIQPVLLDRNNNHVGFVEHPRITSLRELRALLPENRNRGTNEIKQEFG
jgi:putative hydrolase of the HAD superfamily